MDDALLTKPDGSGSYANYLRNQHIVAGLVSHRKAEGFHRIPPRFFLFLLALAGSVSLSLSVEAFGYGYSALQVILCVHALACTFYLP